MKLCQEREEKIVLPSNKFQIEFLGNMILRVHV